MIILRLKGKTLRSHWFSLHVSSDNPNTRAHALRAQQLYEPCSSGAPTESNLTKRKERQTHVDLCDNGPFLVHHLRQRPHECHGKPAVVKIQHDLTVSKFRRKDGGKNVPVGKNRRFLDYACSEERIRWFLDCTFSEVRVNTPRLGKRDKDGAVAEGCV